MELLSKELERLYQLTLDNINITELKKTVQKKKMDKLCEGFPYFVAVVHIPSIMPVYFCRRSREYLGMPNLDFNKMSMTFYKKVLHPDNGQVFQLGIYHFFSQPYELFSMTYKINVPDQGWRWLYGVSKMLTKEEAGGALYTITVLCDVESLFEAQLDNPDNPHQALLTKEEKMRYLLLTTREKEVLQLISKELSAKEISAQLFISEHTIKSHRKSILKKLKIKSSVGMVKYALYQNYFLDAGI